MKQYTKEFPVERMAEVLGVSRSVYDRFLKARSSARDQKNEALLEQIRLIHRRSQGTYGSPRIHAELQTKREKGSRRRIASLMKGHGITAKMFKRFKRTTFQAESPSFVDPDLLQQDFKGHEPNEAWVSDRTAIPTQNGWVYCAIILDLFSRRIVGLAIDKRMTTGI